MTTRTSNLASVVVALSLALGLAALILVSFGESPALLFQALYATFFTDFGLGYSLYYTTPLIFTGLSFAVARQCGLFNIGAEGQLYLGAVSLVAASFPLSNVLEWLGILGLGIAAFLGGAVWGAIAGVLKAKRSTHEVIVTLLLNFIAMGLVSYLILGPFKNTEGQNPETVFLAPSLLVMPLETIFRFFGAEVFVTIPVNVVLFFAIFLAFLVHQFLFHTTWGFALRAVGENPRASQFSGISVARCQILAFAFSGGLAGLVAVNDILGSEHRLVDGFSPGYGFTGIAVALLARNRPLPILASAFLFGSLQNFSRELEFLSDKVTKEVSLILQATILALVASHWLRDYWRRRRQA